MSDSDSDVPPAPVQAGANPWWRQWNPDQVILSDESVDDAWKVCVIEGVYYGENEYNGNLGGRISSVFVILITSLIVTLFPVIAKRIKWMRIPRVIYMIAKNFGTGVIVTTAFIHLMDPAYGAIGGNTCVGMTGHWADYSWCPAIMLAAAVLVFLVDTYADFAARRIYAGHSHSHDVEGIVTGGHDHDLMQDGHLHNHERAEQGEGQASNQSDKSLEKNEFSTDVDSVTSVDREFSSQFAGFLILEFGVIFHSVMIGLTLGTTDEYSTLYVVLVFHQAFEGLGIGARLSMIPFPQGKRWWPYALCLAYSLATPIAIAIGLGVRTTYRDDSYNALVIQGTLDAISAGILIYTGMVELLARDFIFATKKIEGFWDLTLQLFVFLWGAGLMALLGKWA